MAKKTLYDRLGGIYKIAAVVDHFAETLAEDPVAGKYSSTLILKTGTEEDDGESRGSKY